MKQDICWFKLLSEIQLLFLRKSMISKPRHAGATKRRPARDYTIISASYRLFSILTSLHFIIHLNVVKDEVNPTTAGRIQFDARIRFIDTSLVRCSTPKHYVHISTHNARVKRYDYRKSPTENNLSDVTRFRETFGGRIRIKVEHQTA